MAEPTANIRHAVKARFVRRLRQQPELAGVQVENGWPGDLIEADSIWVAGCVGDTEVPHMKAGRRHRQDDFTMTVVVQAGLVGEPDTGRAEERAAELLAGVDQVLAEWPTLAENGTAMPGLQVFGDEMSIDGPNTYRTPQGALSFYTLQVSVKTRYQ